MKKRDATKYVWKCLYDTLYSDIYFNGASYIYDQFTDVEAQIVKEAAEIVLERIRKKSK